MPAIDDVQPLASDGPLAAGAHGDAAQALHSAVSDLIRSNIESGRWPPHYKLRAEPELAAELGISRGTLRRAVQSLVDEGRLVRTHGRGTFVTAAEPEPAIAQEFFSLSEALAQEGVTARIDGLESSMSVPPSQVRGLLDLDQQQPTLRLARRYLVDDRPVWYLVTYLRLDLCPGIENVDFASHSVFGTLESEYGLTLAYGRRTFTARGADREVAQVLQVAAGSPILYFEQVTYVAGGTPVEYSDVWVRSDRLKLSSLLTRHPRARPSVVAREPNGAVR